MIRVFTTEDLNKSLGEQKTEALVQDFRAYKEGKGLPPTFGREAGYHFTYKRYSLELQHVHLEENGFPFWLVQFSRTSGYVLVYCPGAVDKNVYLLIAIIKHWNHETPNIKQGTDRDPDLMGEIENIAEQFRERF